MKLPPTATDAEASRLRCALIFNEPEAWKIIAVWRMACAAVRAKNEKRAETEVATSIYSDNGAQIIQNFTGMAREDAKRWTGILLNAQIVFANGEVDEFAADFIRAKMQLEIDPEAKKGAT